MSRTIKERSKGMSMPFILFQLVQLMVCFRDFIGERIDKTLRKGELLFSKTIILTRQDIWGWRRQKGAPQLHAWRASLFHNVQQGAGCLAFFASSVHSLPLLLNIIKSFFIMLSLWWLSMAVLAAGGNGFCTTSHAGSFSINKNENFRLHYKIILLIELKTAHPS